MAITIVQKGETVQLRGKNTVSKALVGLGWDPNEGQSAHAFDLDASIVARDAAGKAVEVCYFGNQNPAQWIRHTGDNLTGQGDGDDEQIEIDLSGVPADIQALDVVVNIYQGKDRAQSFGMVENSFVRLENQVTGAETLRYDLMAADVFDEVGLWFARIRRDGPTWAFEAKGDFSPENATLQSFCDRALP